LMLAGATPHNPLIQTVFSLITLAGGSFVIWSLPFAIHMVAGKKYDRRFLFYFILSFLLASILSNYILKNVFMRTRPYILFELYSPVCPPDFSFPSGHATVSFAAATMLARYDRKRKYLYYIAAVLLFTDISLLSLPV
jgi:undecaprenyl-diphosphatase